MSLQDFLAVFFAVVFLAVVFLAGAFFAAVFLAGAFFAAVFLAGAFFAAVFFAGVFFAAVFLAAAFLAAAFVAGAFFAVRLLGRGLRRQPPSWPPPSSPAAAFFAPSRYGRAQLRQLLRAGDDRLQVGACAELRDRGLLGLDPLAGARVAHPAGVTDALLEGAEASDGDLLALGDLAGDRVEDRLEGVRCGLLAVAFVARREGARSADSCSLASLS